MGTGHLCQGTISEIRECLSAKQDKPEYIVHKFVSVMKKKHVHMKKLVLYKGGYI